MSAKLVPKLAGHLIIWFAIINLSCVIHTKGEIRVGPWGSVEEVNKWTYEPTGDINHITVSYTRDVVRSICFTSIDENGNLDKSKFTCKEATKTAQIEIDVKTEKINCIRGTFDTVHKNSKTITSLSFTTTSNKTYGPFGTAKGKAFSLVVKDKSFTGFYGSTGQSSLEGIGVILSTPPTETTQDYGPWGGPGGDNQYDYTPTGFISGITLTYADSATIYSIIFRSEDQNGVSDTSRVIGRDAGSNKAEISLDVNNGERLTGISGVYGYYVGYLVLTSLQFYTNKGKTYGPYGDWYNDGTPFEYKGQNSYISGFFGHDGTLIDSLNIHVKALSVPSLTFGEWGNTNAANAWTYEPSDGISHISITYGISIYSITFTSTSGDIKTVGLHKLKKGHGNEKINKIDIDLTKEKLIGISGTVGNKESEGITSLTFVTDNNQKFGPFGTEKGTTFSLPLKGGYISGFHGSSGERLEAIGVYVKST